MRFCLNNDDIILWVFSIAAILNTCICLSVYLSEKNQGFYQGFYQAGVFASSSPWGCKKC
jgi:hypothetical protein